MISSGKVFATSQDKKLYVLDLKTGKKLFEHQAKRSYAAGPAVGDGVIVTGDSAGNVYCFEPQK
jgi:outer membrane protein assembly factor BamB